MIAERAFTASQYQGALRRVIGAGDMRRVDLDDGMVKQMRRVSTNGESPATTDASWRYIDDADAAAPAMLRDPRRRALGPGAATWTPALRKRNEVMQDDD